MDYMTPPLIASSTALFLDFDGTLAPIQSDPDTVYLPEGGAEVLLSLADKLRGALVILSGRDIRDLAQRIPAEIWRAGGHGAFVCPPGVSPPLELPEAPPNLVAAISALTTPLAGVRVEPKGPVLAIHYRDVPEHGLRLEKELSRLIDAFPDYTLQAGKMVIEARPRDAHKGECIRKLMKNPPFSGRTPLMIGDDTTDEDAMLVSLKLGGSAIKVGQGFTAAPFNLADPADVWAWLRKGLK